MSRYYKVLLTAVSFLTLTSFSYSQENHIRIVRVSYAEGSVQLNNQSVTPNMPVIEGNVLACGVDSFAEIEFEDGSTLRLGPNTQLIFAQLARLSSGEALTRVDLDEGELEIKTTSRMPGEFAIGAANKNIRVPGRSRVRVLSTRGDPLELAVWAGEVTIHDPESGQDVAVEKEETFTLAADDPQQYDLEKGIEADGLDQFSESRDQYFASDYVSVDRGPATPPPVVIGSGFIDPCQVYYWYPGLPQNCFSPFYYYPSFSYGYVYVPGYYYHHHHHHPIIHPPTPAAAVARTTNSGPGDPRVTGARGEPAPHPVHMFNDETFKRRAPVQQGHVQDEHPGKSAVDEDRGSVKPNKDSESARSRPVEPTHSVDSRHSSLPAPVSHAIHSSAPSSHSSSPSSHSSSSSYSGSSASHSSGGSSSGGSSSHSSSSSGSSGRSK